MYVCTCDPRDPNGVKGRRQGDRDLLRGEFRPTSLKSGVGVRQVDGVSSEFFV